MADYSLSAEAGGFGVSELNTALVFERKLSAGVNEVALTGNNVDLDVNRNTTGFYRKEVNMLISRKHVFQGNQYYCRAQDVETLFNYFGAARRVTLTPGADVAINPRLGNTFTLIPDQATEIDVSPVDPGALTLIIATSGTDPFNVTFGEGFKSQGVLSTGSVSGKAFVVQFISNGTVYCEVSRTAAM